MKNDVLFYKAPFNLYISIKNGDKLRDINKKMPVTYCHFFNLMKEFFRLKLIYRKNHKYYFTELGMALQKKLLKINDLIKEI